ncbi:MAG: hypothetical protein NZZ41_01165 [Candidatus Dojkabacteria bacterium]|nr:hypothetical protein [Candidatus Dojkabacteria bacterium]
MALQDSIREALVRKWRPLVEHIRDDRKAEITAQLLEQENRYFKGLLTEAPSSAGGATYSAVAHPNASNVGQTSGIARFQAIAMPLVARVFPELVTNDLVGVQPMFTPVGLAYALRYRYQSEFNGKPGFPGKEAGYNTVEALYSGGYPVTATSTPTSADFIATWPNVVDNGRVKGGDGTYNDCGVPGGLVPRGGYRTGDAEGLGELHWNGVAEMDRIRYMGLSVERQTVEAKTRKLAARWSHEAQQDLKNMHNVDLAAQLSDLLAYEIAAEIDAEVKANIIALAQVGGVLVWDYNSSNFGGADGRWEQEKFRTLYTVFLKASNEIAVATRRGAGNFILASPGVVAAIEALEQFALSSVATNLATEVSGVAKVGTIGRFTVYRDMFATNDYAVVGYKGRDDADAGIIYLPYVPIQFLEAVGQDSFNPRIGVMTRYGLCNNLFGAENYYRYIDVRGLSSSSLAGSV